MKKYVYRIGNLSEDDKKSLVLECEKNFEDQLVKASETILASKNKIITLSGPTCSGKTTTASRFIGAIERSGGKVGVISIDDFYKSREQLDRESLERGLDGVDYDSALSIDLDYFEECMDAILEKRNVLLPKYSFGEGRRVKYDEFDSGLYDYIILEGIQAVYPEVTSHIHCGFKSVQIAVRPDIEVNGSSFSSRQLRFLRRMIRDARTRNAPPEMTFDMWKGVSANEELHIMPYEGQYDIELDSFMKYEPFMTKPYVDRLLADLDTDHEFYYKAEEIKEKIKDLFVISSDYLPKRSVYREFLG